MESQIKVTPNGADASPKVVVQLGAEVVEVDCDVCSVTLKSGEIHTADAIIGADGAHGVVRRKLLEDEGVESAQGVPTGLSLYRYVCVLRIAELP
jgi:salicylate hydroxylase